MDEVNYLKDGLQDMPKENINIPLEISLSKDEIEIIKKVNTRLKIMKTEWKIVFKDDKLYCYKGRPRFCIYIISCSKRGICNAKTNRCEWQYKEKTDLGDRLYAEAIIYYLTNKKKEANVLFNKALAVMNNSILTILFHNDKKLIKFFKNDLKNEKIVLSRRLLLYIRDWFEDSIFDVYNENNIDEKAIIIKRIKKHYENMITSYDIDEIIYRYDIEKYNLQREIMSCKTFYILDRDKNNFIVESYENYLSREYYTLNIKTIKTIKNLLDNDELYIIKQSDIRDVKDDDFINHPFSINRFLNRSNENKKPNSISIININDIKRRKKVKQLINVHNLINQLVYIETSVEMLLE